MIISHKYKYLFIGLPFSASSAISKELHLRYDGETYLRKHSVYYEFEKVATRQEKDYFVFAVLRHPMDIVITSYEKMKANAKGNFTNPKLFTENGGHITKNQREKFKFIHEHKATFQQYFKRFFQHPYDNLASLTIENCDYVIRHENFADDYFTALKKAGILNPRPLPVANKTVGKKKKIFEYYTDEIKEEAVYVFGPFLEKYNYSFPESWGDVRASKKSRIQFTVFGILRKINQRYFKRLPKRLSLKGSIYGNIQRKDQNNIS